MRNKKNMTDFVVSLLKENLPKSYTYHNYEHTQYVVEKAIEIGKQENCNVDELELLKVAALWHDTGYTKTYEGHEEFSCLMARQHLPEYGYMPSTIDEVCNMIMATKIPQSPKSKLDKILADADLEYLGSSKNELISGKLFKELLFKDPSLTIEEWNKKQISFLQNHQYFTNYCMINKEPIKQAFLTKLLCEL